MPDNTVDTARDQRMPGLDGDQSAESAAENKHWPQSQRAANRKQNHAEPANRIAVENPDLLPVGPGRTNARSRPITPKAPITQRLLRSSDRRPSPGPAQHGFLSVWSTS